MAINETDEYCCVQQNNINLIVQLNIRFVIKIKI